MPKNIVICCDGTNNAVAGDQTNVLRLFRTLVRGHAQAVYYDAGVGTRADPTAQWPLRRLVRKQLDAAIGVSVRASVLAAYRFLAHQFAPGDSVYLFGFSRGAYTVRAVAAMVKRCGLLHPEHLNLAEYAWAVFTDEDQSGDARTRFAGAARIKKVFGRAARIHFLGAWDTVSSFGWMWDLLTIPNTATNNMIRHVRHAVSIDERRGCFRPNLVRPAAKQDCLEVWFPGVHADVGGGYRDAEAGLARLPLEWMLREAAGCGLLVDSGRRAEVLKQLGDPACPPPLAAQHDESVRWMWRLIGLLPRRAYDSERGGRAWRWPSGARPRTIPERALIHESALDRMADPRLRYRPKLPREYRVVS